MITHEGVRPYAIWWNAEVEEFEKKVHRSIVRDLLSEIEEDLSRGVPEATIQYLYEGNFRIIGISDMLDLKLVGEKINGVIAEYDLKDYL